MYECYFWIGIWNDCMCAAECIQQQSKNSFLHSKTISKLEHTRYRVFRYLKVFPQYQSAENIRKAAYFALSTPSQLRWLSISETSKIGLLKRKFKDLGVAAEVGRWNMYGGYAFLILPHTLQWRVGAQKDGRSLLVSRRNLSYCQQSRKRVFEPRCILAHKLTSTRYFNRIRHGRDLLEKENWTAFYFGIVVDYGVKRRRAGGCPISFGSPKGFLVVRHPDALPGREPLHSVRSQSTSVGDVW